MKKTTLLIFLLALTIASCEKASETPTIVSVTNEITWTQNLVNDPGLNPGDKIPCDCEITSSLSKISQQANNPNAVKITTSYNTLPARDSIYCIFKTTLTPPVEGVDIHYGVTCRLTKVMSDGSTTAATGSSPTTTNRAKWLFTSEYNANYCNKKLLIMVIDVDQDGKVRDLTPIGN